VATDADSGGDFCSFYTADYATDASLRPKVEVTFESATP